MLIRFNIPTIFGMNQRADNFFHRHQRIGLDSNIIIALVEDNPTLSDQIEDIFTSMVVSRHQIWLSVIGVTEVLIKPTTLKNALLKRQYEDLLFSGQFSFADVSLEVSRKAAELNLKVRDALHVASLIEAGVTGFITADKGIKSTKELEVFALTG